MTPKNYSKDAWVVRNVGFRSYWIPGSYAPALPEKRNSFLRLLKNKGFTEESLAKVGLYAISTSTTLESNKSLYFNGYLLKAGHPLEGSCQEGKHPPYTPFCIFCRGMSHGISLPICRFARTRVFSDCDVTRSMATHQTPIRIKAHDGRLALWPGIRPLAHIVPQKTLGTLPCPIVTSTVHVALPEGSTPKLARGRGVTKTRQVAWRPSVRG